MKRVEKLTTASVKLMNFPLNDLPFDESPPDQTTYWMSPELTSLYDTEVWDTLTETQRIELSQREFCLICSISCNGEKEAISDISKLMLKRRFAEVRPYLSHLIREENNHIDMFAEFCQRYGELTRFRYIYTKGDQCTDPAFNDLLAFIHLLVFEELGDNFNRAMAKDESLPALVRAINKLHVEEEARHIAFGRDLLTELAKEVTARSTDEQMVKLHDYVYQYVQSRHHEYHSIPIYSAIGISDAYDLRDQLIHERDARYFFRMHANPDAGLNKLLSFLQSIDLIGEHHVAHTLH